MIKSVTLQGESMGLKTPDNYLDFCINKGFITPANNRGKISYRLVAVPEDSLTSTIVENLHLVIPESATSRSSLNEGGRRQPSNFPDRASLIKCENSGKNSNELSINLDRGVDVDLDLEGNIDAKNLLSFYKQKIILLENQNSFLLKQNNFLQHQIDQNNKIVLKILTNSSHQVETNLQKSEGIT